MEQVPCDVGLDGVVVGVGWGVRGRKRGEMLKGCFSAGSVCLMVM